MQNKINLELGRPYNDGNNKSKKTISRLCIYINRNLHKQLKQKALDEETSVNSIVTKIIEEYLTK